MDNDLLLLEAVKQLNKEALIKIFDLYAPPLYNYALRLCRDPLAADHIVGDVFARLLEQLAAGNGPKSNLRSYLYETAYHIVIDEARSANRWEPLDVLTSLRPDVRSTHLGYEDQLMLERVLEAIQHELTDDQRHVIILRFLEDFSLRETATILGKKVSHIKVIQFRALAKLRQVFDSREIRTTLSLSRVRETSTTVSV